MNQDFLNSSAKVVFIFGIASNKEA